MDAPAAADEPEEKPEYMKGRATVDDELEDWMVRVRESKRY